MAVQRSGRKMVLRIAAFSVVMALLTACGGNTKTVEATEEAEANQEPMTAEEAKNVYVLHCESCHGMDGKKKSADAADLSLSTLPDDKILEMIKNGNDKGMMPYDQLLTEREKNGLVEFVKTLR
jgi:mono/diheme cytochrome c family protein